MRLDLIIDIILDTMTYATLISAAVFLILYYTDQKNRKNKSH